MLLTTGERISMSLLSLALNDLDCPAISFTGSQAGVLTDDSHSNALITDIKCPRVTEALQRNQVVILAGFQGVSPKTKEVTTLGRGGTDTTAVAMAAALNADHCEILKDVPGVFSADPKLCSKAFSLNELSYPQLLEMTFWGAKVLHYRSVELAYRRGVPLYIGPAHDIKSGTWIKPKHNIFTSENFEPSQIKKESLMFETTKILSLNSHSDVLKLSMKQDSLAVGLQKLQQEFNALELPFPQLLTTESPSHPELEQSLYLTGPQEVLNTIKKEIKNFSVSKEQYCTITATCTGVSTPKIASQITQKLHELDLQPIRLWMSGMSCTLLLLSDQRQRALSHLHTLIEE
jgi:aspartate kinase